MLEVFWQYRRRRAAQIFWAGLRLCAAGKLREREQLQMGIGILHALRVLIKVGSANVRQ